MKFMRVISFAIISALSIGTIVAVAEVNKVPVDRTFTIEDLSGDRSILEGVTLENIIKTDTNTFEKVYLNNEDVIFEKTKFDLKYGVGEEILAHKDLYRGMNHALKLETDAVLLTVKFNSLYPYASNEAFVELAMKNKKSDEVLKEKITLADLNMNQQIVNEAVLEIDGVIYYCMTVGDTNGNSANQSIRIYEINPKSLQLQVVNITDISLTGDYANSTNVIADGKHLFTIVYNDQEFKLVSYNLLTKETEVTDLPSVTEKLDYIQFFALDTQSIFLQEDEAMLIVDRQTGQLINEEAAIPDFKNNYDYVYSVEHIIKDDILYVLYGTYTEGIASDQLIVAYDGKDGNIVYEGKLPSMADRGVGKDYSFLQ